MKLDAHGTQKDTHNLFPHVRFFFCLVFFFYIFYLNYVSWFFFYQIFVLLLFCLPHFQNQCFLDDSLFFSKIGWLTIRGWLFEPAMYRKQ